MDFDVRRRKWYQANKNSGEPTWSNVYAWVSRDQLALNAGAPVYDKEGKFQGVLATDLVLSYVSNFLSCILHLHLPKAEAEKNQVVKVNLD
ncbi:MAG: hypothetical protein F6K22_03730 [Okeania sp. SIO2F4]|nr:PDC sensor domain-containing protein [Okeania sp. SIO2F4]NES02015.1 hypothetical protein [Okeania sp. SIO2F4]